MSEERFFSRDSSMRDRNRNEACESNPSTSSHRPGCPEVRTLSSSGPPSLQYPPPESSHPALMRRA